MTGKRKTLQELTIMDGFLFGAVMMDPENCRLLLERILEIPISRVDNPAGEKPCLSSGIQRNPA